MKVVTDKTDLPPRPDFEALDRVDAFWDENLHALRESHREQFVAVAVSDFTILDSGPDLFVLVDRLRARGIEGPAVVSVRFVPSASRRYIL